MTYGVLDNSSTVQSENLLPLGLAKGCSLKRDLEKDAVITYDDVDIPPNRLIDKLYTEQNIYFN